MQTGSNIKKIMITASGLFLSCLLLLPTVNAQHKVGIDSHLGCSDQEVLLPVYVSDFMDVSSFSFYLTADTTAMELIGVENEHAQLAEGNVESYLSEITQTLNVTWFAMIPANINEGKLFDLRIQMKRGYVSLDFTENCELTRSDLSIVENVEYTNGLLGSIGGLPVNPLTADIEVGENVAFIVPEHDGLSYQWQEKDNADWMDLQNNTYYNGVNTNELEISSVPLSFNNRSYRCVVSNQQCTEFTNEAVLHVTVGIAETGEGGRKPLVYPNPARDHINIQGEIEDAEEIRIMNTDGRLVFRDDLNGLDLEKGLKVDLNGFSPGLYFIRLMGKQQHRSVTKFILKP
ncbi:MAG: T9SS type A sorting domain-containing protein [Bacteroidales bacterium]|nr:T9SS type A sorting domain-containing protein [Bacteroidales bacterium]